MNRGCAFCKYTEPLYQNTLKYIVVAWKICMKPHSKCCNISFQKPQHFSKNRHVEMIYGILSIVVYLVQVCAVCVCVWRGNVIEDKRATWIYEEEAKKKLYTINRRNQVRLGRSCLQWKLCLMTFYYWWKWASHNIVWWECMISHVVTSNTMKEKDYSRNHMLLQLQWHTYDGNTYLWRRVASSISGIIK